MSTLTSPSTGTETTTDVDAEFARLTGHQEADDNQDHERFAHYVRKEAIIRAAADGVPAIAICGKVWVPRRDPQKYPVCPTCQEIYDGFLDRGED